MKNFNLLLLIYLTNGSGHSQNLGKDYLIEIRDEPWYSVVTILPDK